MKAYEVMLITDPKLDEDAQGAVLERAKGVITADGGVVDAVDAWGRRRFAYEIKGAEEGDYTLISFHAPTPNVAELDRVLHITDPVLRFMIVRRDDLG